MDKKTIRFEKVNKCNYAVYYECIQQSMYGNLMLPYSYSKNLWGVICWIDNSIVGGWVGILRGNNMITRCLTKSVCFDSYPFFNFCDFSSENFEMFMHYVRECASKDNIIALSLTHWVRGMSIIKMDIVEDNATFVFDLSEGIPELYNHLDRLKKRTLKKAEESNLSVDFLEKECAIGFLSEFQQLRKQTQDRAISKNPSASMLLKSDSFFQELFLTTKTTLVLVRENKKVIAGATFIESGNTVYGHMAGSDAEANRRTGAGTYYYWKAIVYFKEKGLHFFDFGGCPVNPLECDPAYSIYLFKKGFGGEYKINKRGVIIIQQTKYKLLQYILSHRKLLRIFSKLGM